MSSVNCESLSKYTATFHPDTTVDDLTLDEFWTVFTHLGGVVHVLEATSYVDYERKYLVRQQISRTMKLSEVKDKLCAESHVNGVKKI